MKGDIVKLLLTSGGVTNPSILAALTDLLGKDVADSDALLIATAQWGQPACSPQSVWRTAAGRGHGGTGLVDLGWRSVGMLELTALPTIGADRWVPWVQEADVLLVDGGEAVYLAHWMRESGLADLLPTLEDTVWVGVSAGSMVMTPSIGDEFVDWRPGAGDATLGLVDFSIFPHLDYPGWAGNTRAKAREWAARMPRSAYALDDQSALVVEGSRVAVVSEGDWELFTPPSAPSSSPPSSPPSS